MQGLPGWERVAHFLLSHRGIFPAKPPHLTKLGGGAIWTWWCLGGGLPEFLVTDGVVGEFRRPERGVTDGVGLTCLSIRCLSSYLIFSASSSDQQLRAKLARGHAPVRDSA